MQGPVTKAMIETGIIPQDALGELKKWGYMVESIEPTGTFDTPEEMVQHIMEAVESPGAVHTRDTDFTVLKQYLTTKVKGKLHVPNPEDESKTVGITVFFGKTKMKDEVILPYLDENIMDMLLDTRTYLKPVGESKIYFTDTRTLYYDDHPAFVVCAGMSEAK